MDVDSMATAMKEILNKALPVMFVDTVVYLDPHYANGISVIRGQLLAIECK